MAVRGPIPPITFTGMRNPNNARLGTVCMMLAKANTHGRALALRDSRIPAGRLIAIAMAIETATRNKCWYVCSTISLARPGRILDYRFLQARQKRARFFSIGFYDLGCFREDLQSPVMQQPEGGADAQRLANVVRHEDRRLAELVAQ